MIIEYYIIAAMSFALMYTYSYGLEISKTVVDVLNLFDMSYKDHYVDKGWNPNMYIFWSFIVALIAMPLVLLIVLFENKYKTVKEASGSILKDSYGFEEDKK